LNRSDCSQPGDLDPENHNRGRTVDDPERSLSHQLAARRLSREPSLYDFQFGFNLPSNSCR
jgi:hypothetical protein